MGNDAAAVAFLARARLAIPLALCGLWAIIFAGGLGGLIVGKEQFTLWLFLRQDLAVLLILGIILRFSLHADRSAGEIAWTTAVSRHPWMLAVSLGLLCWGGHSSVLSGYDLTRDEQMASFDRLVFAGGRLAFPVAQAWQPMAEALNQSFILPIAERQAWVSAYLPVNAAARVLAGWIGDPNLASPAFTAIGALALWRITVRLWPDDAGARAVALLLYAGSSQVILLGMTSYAMAGHLALNLVWLALFLGGGWWHVAAIAIGFLATGLHQPLFHPLFALPFLVGLLIGKRWALTILYAGAYLAIGLFWLSWPQLVAQTAGGAMETLSATGDRFGYIDRVAGMLQQTGLVGLPVMAMNLLRFVAWQHLLLLPLLTAGLCLSWRAPLVRPLAAGILATIFVVGVLLAYQGHGWGYRYLHGLIGSACLIGGHGWRALRAVWPGRRLWAFANAATFLLLLPLHLVMASLFTTPYADAAAAIARLPAPIAVIDEGAAAFASDLVINRPDLSNRPIRLLAGSLTTEQIAGLCSGQDVAFVGRAELTGINQRIAMSPGDDSHFRALEQTCRQGAQPAAAPPASR